MQPNANSVPACNTMIITFTQLLSVTFTLSMSIHHSLYWKNISFLWIHILNKKSKQRNVLYQCNCKLYLWVRQSFAKCCKTHPVLKLPHILTVSSKSNKPLLAKIIRACVLQFLEGQVGEEARDAQVQDFSPDTAYGEYCQQSWKKLYVTDQKSCIILAWLI